MSATETNESAVRQEPDELAQRRIAVVTVASVLVSALALLVAWHFLERWGHPLPHRVPLSAPRTIGILEQTLILDTERGVDLRREQAASLARWRWVDRDAGIVQVPIDVAIDALVASPPPPDGPLERKGPTP